MFIPEMLGRTAWVESRCPETGQLIRLSVSPTGVASLSHRHAVMSFILPDGLGDDARKTMASFCHYVFLFASPAAGATWIQRHPGSFLLTLPEAFELGRRQNRAQFPELTAG